MNFSYDENKALQGGVGAFVNRTGAYKGKITLAKWTRSQLGAEALELSFESDQGEKVDYLTIYYQGKDGKSIDFGVNLIQAIMGCTGVKNLSRLPTEQALLCPELQLKPIGLFLQKVLYTKQDGSDGYRFQVITPFSPKSGKTLSEYRNNEDAKRVPDLIATMKDKDEREKPKRGRPPKAKTEQKATYSDVMTEEEAKEALYDTPFDDIPF